MHAWATCALPDPCFVLSYATGSSAAQFICLSLISSAFCLVMESKQFKKMRKDAEKRQKALDKAAKEIAKREAKDAKHASKAAAKLEKEEAQLAKRMAKVAVENAKAEAKAAKKSAKQSSSLTTSVYLPPSPEPSSSRATDHDRVQKMTARAQRLNGVYSRSTDQIYFNDNTLVNGPLPIGTFFLLFC